MGKYATHTIAGYWLYYTTVCRSDYTVHVHVNHPTTHKKDSAKIWVHADGTSTVADYGKVSKKDMYEIQQWIKDNLYTIASHWDNPRDKFKYTDTCKGDDALVSKYLKEHEAVNKDVQTTKKTNFFS